MNSLLRNISIKDAFWIQFNNNLISFGFAGLPDKTHFTIVFDEKLQDVNFHVTKNDSSQINKPQIKIFVINRKVLIENASTFSLALLKTMIKPFDFEKFNAENNEESGFFCYDTLQNSELYKDIKEKIIKDNKVLSEFNESKSRLKINANITKQLEDITNSDEFASSLERYMISLSEGLEKSLDRGFILNGEKVTHLLRIQNIWYEIKLEHDAFKLLCFFLKPEVARSLIWKTKKSLVSLKNAKTYEDVKHLNKPIRLILSKQNDV